VYTSEHPYNHPCAGNLALLRRVPGAPEVPRKTNEHALTGLERQPGRGHRYSLPVALRSSRHSAPLGATEAAFRLCSDRLRPPRALLGATPPTTLTAAANTTASLRDLGRHEEAAELAAETEEGYRRTLTLDHPDAQVFLEGRRLDADFDPPPI